MSPNVRKLALTVHLTSSVGWTGALFVYLALGVAAVTSSDPQTVRAAWTAMDLTGWWVIVPLALAALVTGVLMSLGTRWGLFRHYWTLISLALTVVCTGVLLLHMPTVSRMALLAQQVEGDNLRALGGDLFHPGVGLLLLLAIMLLNVYKPAGVTPYGWRKQREHAQAISRVPTRQPSARARAVSFTFHFAEMLVAMFAGMAAFMLSRVVLTTLGITVAADPTSLEFEIGMSMFMLVPMLAWMRFRGCDWRECAEISAAMLLWPLAAVGLRALALENAALWVTTNQHALMLASMLGVMLHRRDHYTRGYALPGSIQPA
jgi:hypothetical protein